LGKTASRPTSAEFVVFLDEVVASVQPGRQIHIIADNLSTHKTKAVEAFLRAHPHVDLHLTPTYSSWLNQVEIWFSKIQRDIIARVSTGETILAYRIDSTFTIGWQTIGSA
jgi:transposase